MPIEINLPTKATQDAIKAKTDLVGVANPASAGTDSLFNYLKKIDDKPAPTGGTDWSIYKNQFLISGDNLVTKNNTYQTVLNITGKKGYLSKCLFFCSHNSSTVSYLRITMDGVVIFDAGNDNYGYTHFGIIKAEHLLGTPAGLLSGPSVQTLDVKEFKALPVTSISTLALIGESLMFNDSLKVEFRDVTGTVTKTTIIGGTN